MSRAETPVKKNRSHKSLKRIGKQSLALPAALKLFPFAQAHLGVLGALYGALRPLDGILHHRLGMEGTLRVDGQDLYGFWGDRVYRAIAKAEGPVVNLASMAYAKMVLPHMSGRDPIVTCRFLLQRPDCSTRVTVATVRAARGPMVRYIIKNRINMVEGLTGFDLEG